MQFFAENFILCLIDSIV